MATPTAATNPDHFDPHNVAKADAVDVLRKVAGEARLPLTHPALAWAAEHPAVSSVLLGPRTEFQLADLLGAADVELDDDVLDAIDAIVPPGTDLNPAGPRLASPRRTAATAEPTSRPEPHRPAMAMMTATDATVAAHGCRRPADGSAWPDLGAVGSIDVDEPALIAPDPISVAGLKPVCRPSSGSALA